MRKTTRRKRRSRALCKPLGWGPRAEALRRLPLGKTRLRATDIKAKVAN
jgi:hypothetical protein